MIKLYFVDAIPSSSNPAHENGTIKKLERRERVGARLTAKLTSLADVVQEALDSGCINVEPRGNLERFVQGDFKMATKQILKNYLRLREYISVETRNPCRKLYKKMTRKVERYDGNLREKYCDKVYREEWCDKEYTYSLDKRVEGKE